MGVSIDLSGLKVKGNARVMNDVKITGYEDAKIRAENTEIDGNVEFLERLEIGPVLDEVQRQLRNLDPSSAEYRSLKQIVEMKNTAPQSIMNALKKHLADFSQGVLKASKKLRLSYESRSFFELFRTLFLHSVVSARFFPYSARGSCG